jgi:hypothetical protein
MIPKLQYRRGKWWCIHRINNGEGGLFFTGDTVFEAYDKWRAVFARL